MNKEEFLKEVNKYFTPNEVVETEFHFSVRDENFTLSASKRAKYDYLTLYSDSGTFTGNEVKEVFETLKDHAEEQIEELTRILKLLKR